jgi:hypothetical protein
MTLDELRSAATEGTVDTVLLCIADMEGRLQGKRLTTQHFLEEVVEHDAEGCNYLLAVDVDMNTVGGYAMSSWESGYGDFVLKPDFDTLRPGPWHERLPHFRLDFTPSNGEEVQSEYFVPREHGLATVQALHEVSSGFAHLVQATEIRTVAADNHWMSPCYQRDTVAVHFTWVKDQPRVLEVLPLVEAALAPYGAVPHWAKLTTMAVGDVRAGFPRIGDFRELARSLDLLGIVQDQLLWMVRVSERSTDHWFNPSKLLERDISEASYARYVSCTANLDEGALWRAYLSAWSWGKDLMPSLAEEHDGALPTTLLDRIDQRFMDAYRRWRA